LNIYRRKIILKALLLGAALLVVIASQRYTQSLVMRLKAEERSKVELWAMATGRLITSSGEESDDYEIVATIIENNTSVPLILTDGEGNIISSANFRISRPDDKDYLKRELRKIMDRSEPIKIDLGDDHFNYIWYKDSTILRKVRYYPYVQLLVIFLIAAVSYAAFNSSRKAEENRVWAGMARETAHQLGTPVSSLSAWIDMLREKQPGEPLAMEMEKDIERLGKVTQRFSAIGSKPLPESCDLYALVSNTVSYLRNRTSSKVIYSIVNNTGSDRIEISLCAELFEWVVENVCKNAVDAMEGEGNLTITFSVNARNIITDFEDTGKGIPRGLIRTIFLPGYTTKRHGWGLGLSLAKRIVEEYHNGRIFVHSSDPGRGTCMRIVLPLDNVIATGKK
jgi:signal transduction histidine kinase